MQFQPQYVILFHHLRRFLEGAFELAIDAAPLKGAYLLSELYDDGGNRGVLGDFDVLVRPRDFDAACELMERLGFVRQPETMSSRFETAFHFDVGGGRHIMFELHTALFDPYRFVLDHERLWDRSRPGAVDGAPCRHLADEDHFCHIAFHSLIHRLDKLDRDAFDLKLLATRGRVDPGRLIEIAREWETTRIVWFFLMGTGLAGTERFAPCARSLCPARPLARALLALGNKRFRKLLRRQNYRAQALALWPWLFDSPALFARFALHHPSVEALLGGGRLFRT